LRPPDNAITKVMSAHLLTGLPAKQATQFKPGNTMENPTIAQRSPYVREMAPGTYYWCACGRSKSQPFCDGSHKGTAFTPLKVDLTATKKVAWCGCKHSKNAPFCDGSHTKL
jgi:CDGSH iron-sulfur domain-containing protein 3